MTCAVKTERSLKVLNNFNVLSLKDKLYIRGVEDADIPLRVQWLNDPEINRTLNFDLPVTQFSTRQWLSRASQAGNRKDFTLCLREDNRPIGYGGLLSIDWRAGKAEIYGGIGSSGFWGNGYGSALWLQIMEFAFCELGLNKLYSTVWVENTGMCKVHEKLGFMLEGTLRSDVHSHGQLRDRHYYGILKGEFEGRADL